MILLTNSSVEAQTSQQVVIEGRHDESTGGTAFEN